MKKRATIKKARRASPTAVKLHAMEDELSEANSKRIRLQNDVSRLKTKLQLVEADKRAILEKLVQIFELLADSMQPVSFADAMRNGGLPKIDKT